MNINNNHGSRGFVFVFVLMAAIVIFSGVMLYFACTVSSIRLAAGYDTMRQQMSEAAFLSQVLKETILEQRGVSGAPVATDSVGQSFVNHLAPLAGAGNGVSYGFGTGQLPGPGGPEFASAFSSQWRWPESLASGVASTMFPSAARPPLIFSHLDGDAASLACLEHLGQGVIAMLASGPFSEHTTPASGSFPWANPGNLESDGEPGPWHPVPVFGRHVSGGVFAQGISYAGRWRAFGIPVTNFQRIAYGLPATQKVPDAAPAGAMLVGEGSHPLIVTRNNPALDSTAFSDLHVPGDASGQDYLPYRYREQVSGAWDLFEYIFKANGPYLQALGGGASQAGHVFGFDSAGASSVPGFSYDEVTGGVTVDLGALPSTGAGSYPRGVVDDSSVYWVSGGVSGGRVTVKGAPDDSRRPLIIVFSQPQPAGLMVSFNGDNMRPVLIICAGFCTLSFGTIQFSGGVFMDKTCSMAGAPSIYGTLAYYWENQGTDNARVCIDEKVRNILADVAPRFLVVSARFLRK